MSTSKIRDAQVYIAICDYGVDHGGGFPTLRWIADNTDYVSQSGVFDSLRRLEKAGLLEIVNRDMYGRTRFSVNGATFIPPVNDYYKYREIAEGQNGR